MVKQNIQVTYEMKGHNSALEREFVEYKNIYDNDPKFAIFLDKIGLVCDGIINLNLFDFLLNGDFKKNKIGLSNLTYDFLFF